jgi:hypothetical protein
VGAADFARRHRAFRPLLAWARRLRAFRNQLAIPDNPMRLLAGTIALRARALPTRAALAHRRVLLREVLAALPTAPPESRLVSIVLAPGRTFAGPTADVATEVVERAADASGALVCLLAPTADPLDDGWLARLADAVHDDVVAASPVVVRPECRLPSGTEQDLLVASRGYELVLRHDKPVLSARAAGSRPGDSSSVEDVDIGSAACLVVDRRALVAAGGVDPNLSSPAAIVDLSVRLRAAGGRIVVIPDAVIVDHAPVRTRAELHEPFSTHPAEWDAVVARNGPQLYRAVRDPSSPRIAITTAVPSAKVAERWGDWHFGGDLGHALRRAGFEVRLQTANQANSVASRSCDIQLVLHGRADIARASGQRHVLWVISHPETLTSEMVDRADLVLVASSRFADELRARTSTPVETLLQATEPRRFRPRPPDPRYAHPLVVVAKTRSVMRPIVADAIACGLRPSIYGSGWEAFVDPDLVVADYIGNDELPVVYASAGVVLNDHWEAMREHGFVSNRIFDVLACGTPVISDHLPEITGLFGAAVPTYRERDELRELVEDALAAPEPARARAREGQQQVLTAHTFDIRAKSLSEILVRHGLFTPPSP